MFSQALDVALRRFWLVVRMFWPAFSPHRLKFSLASAKKPPPEPDCSPLQSGSLLLSIHFGFLNQPLGLEVVRFPPAFGNGIGLGFIHSGMCQNGLAGSLDPSICCTRWSIPRPWNIPLAPEVDSGMPAPEKIWSAWPGPMQTRTEKPARKRQRARIMSVLNPATEEPSTIGGRDIPKLTASCPEHFSRSPPEAPARQSPGNALQKTPDCKTTRRRNPHRP